MVWGALLVVCGGLMAVWVVFVEVWGGLGYFGVVRGVSMDRSSMHDTNTLV